MRLPYRWVIASAIYILALFILEYVGYYLLGIKIPVDSPSLFGIGIIQLELKDIDSSKVLFPARQRPSLDWETMNKLTEQNKDFNKFIKDVKIDFNSKVIPTEDEFKNHDSIGEFV